MRETKEERDKLIDLWEDITEERPSDDILLKCATQRLMQALGAYGNLVENKSTEWYAQHIPIAAKMLRELVEGTDLAEPILPVLDLIK